MSTIITNNASRCCTVQQESISKEEFLMLPLSHYMIISAKRDQRYMCFSPQTIMVRTCSELGAMFQERFENVAPTEQTRTYGTFATGKKKRVLSRVSECGADTILPVKVSVDPIIHSSTQSSRR